MASSDQIELLTERLLLRSPRADDATDIERLAGEREIAANTATIPHPYPEGAAAEWIALQAQRQRAGEHVTFAMVERESGRLVGAIGLRLVQAHRRAELGYWIGKPYWGRGYATEAARAVLRYGFETLGLNRIHAAHFTRNPASGRVMQKIGMTHEGRLRQHYDKWGVLEDIEFYGILSGEYFG